MTDITVCYAVTHDAQWQRRAAASAYSVARANPGVRVRIAEVDGGEHPWGVRASVMPGEECATEWVLTLDADTWANSNLNGLFVCDADIYLRVGSAWTGGKIDRQKWYAILDRFRLPHLPVYNCGLILCRPRVSSVLRDELSGWSAAIRVCGLPDPLMRFRGKPEWWMRDQFALAALVANDGWQVGELTSREHSFHWKDEPPGIVHHLGSDADPFGDEAWPSLKA